MDIIKKVLYNKGAKQKYVIVPKNSFISAGDYVIIKFLEKGGKNGIKKTKARTRRR